MGIFGIRSSYESGGDLVGKCWVCLAVVGESGMGMSEPVCGA